MNINFERMAAVLLSVTGAGSFLAPGALAQNQPEQNQSTVQSHTVGGPSGLYQRSAGRFGTASDLVGADVYDQQRQRIGTIKDLVFDLPNNRVPLAVISTGQGGRLVAIPPQLLAPLPGQHAVRLKLDRQAFLSAPAFTAQADLNNPAWLRQTYSYYGLPVYWQSGGSVAGTRTITEAAGAEMPRWVSGHELEENANQILHQYQQGRQQARALDEALNGVSGEARYPQYTSAGTETSTARSTTLREPSGAQAEKKPLGNLVRTSDLIGRQVQDNAGRTMGEIRDVVVDWPSNHAAYAMVAGTGDLSGKYFAIPTAAFARQQAEESKFVVLNIGHDKLAAAPSFTAATWPDPSNRTVLGEIYSYFGQTPYWQTEPPTPR